MTGPPPLDAEALRRRRARSRALVAVLLGLAVLFYAVSMARNAQRHARQTAPTPASAATR